jgi:hypothetical protein
MVVEYMNVQGAASIQVRLRLPALAGDDLILLPVAPEAPLRPPPLRPIRPAPQGF